MPVGGDAANSAISSAFRVEFSVIVYSTDALVYGPLRLHGPLGDILAFADLPVSGGLERTCKSRVLSASKQPKDAADDGRADIAMTHGQAPIIPELYTKAAKGGPFG